MMKINGFIEFILNEAGEQEMRVKDMIRREKEADKRKHDKMLDSARTKDTRLTNLSTK